jgi:dipeptidyl aminopeptidase/acylaminoacyl peptidase
VRPEDLTKLRVAGDPRLDPSGSRVAFVVSGIDTEQNRTTHSIWLATLEDAGEPRPLTALEGVAVSPRWSPDGRQLAFLSARDGAPQVYLLPLAGGEARRLTKHEEGVDELAWSPDGRFIAYSARVADPAHAEKDPERREPRRITTLFYRLDGEGWTFDRPRQIFVVDLASGETRQLTTAARDHLRLAWRPDGKAIAFVAAPPEVDETLLARVVYTVELDGSLTELTAADAGAADAPSWSRDGRFLAYRVTSLEGHRAANIAALELETGRPTILTDSLDRQCRPFTTSELREQVWADDKTLVFGVEDAGGVHLYYATAGDGSATPTPLVTGELAINGFDIRPSRLVYTASTPGWPSELFVDWLDNGVRLEGRRLTAFGEEIGALVDPIRFAVPSPAGGEIDAWLVLPPDQDASESRPLITCVHGGPLWQWNGFWPEFQILAAAGFAVLYANPHGSSGKGRAWAGAIRGPDDEGHGWGSADFDDLMAVIDAALERWPSLDPARLGIMGQSYGGYMVAWAIGQTDRFAAAWAENPVVDFVSATGTADFVTILPRWIGTIPYESEEAHATFWRHSPIAHVANVHTPVLIAHSTEDLRCPFGQGQELFAALRLLGREAELLVFPGPHDFGLLGSPAHRLLRQRALLEWWERHFHTGVASAAAREQALA